MSGKWIGAILIIAGSGGFGAAFTLECGREMRMLRQFLRALEVMESELQYRLTPLPQLVMRGSKETGGTLRNIMTAFIHRLESQALPEPESCMNSVLSVNWELPVSMRRLLEELGRSFGEFNLPGQLKALSAVRKEAEGRLGELEKDRHQHWRCWRTLAFCAGIALAVILL